MSESGEPRDVIELVGINTLGAERAAEMRSLIREIPDYPKPGIVFQDITGLLADGSALQDMVEAFARLYEGTVRIPRHEIDLVAAMEARGFMLGAPLAMRLGVGFVPLRKVGKLPPPTKRVDYDLEYGSAGIELRLDTIPPGAKVLIIDDILATGGTAAAAVALIEACGGIVVAVAFLMELAGLGGREKLAGHEVDTLLRVEG